MVRDYDETIHICSVEYLDHTYEVITNDSSTGRDLLLEYCLDLYNERNDTNLTMAEFEEIDEYYDIDDNIEFVEMQMNIVFER